MSKYSSTALTRKRAQFLSSWAEYAQDKSFAGMTLAEFEVKSKEPLDVGKELGDARTKVSGLILKRDQVDDTLNEDLLLIAHASARDGLDDRFIHRCHRSQNHDVYDEAPWSLLTVLETPLTQ